MTITQLQCFVTMAEELSFTATAQKLFISQTAVSYHIKALEENLGAELFTRSTRKVELSDAGKQFYRRIRSALDEIDTACAEVKASAQKKTFAIGYSTLCYGERFRKLVQEFTQQNPELTLFLDNVEPEDNLFELILDGTIDIAVFLNPYNELPKGIELKNCGTVDHFLLVSETHPWAARDGIDEKEIPNSELLAHEGIRRLEEMETTVFGQGNRPGSNNVPKNLASLLSMIRAGLCMSRLPALDPIETPGIHCLQVYGENVENGSGPQLVFAWRENAHSSHISEFCETAEKVILMN